MKISSSPIFYVLEHWFLVVARIQQCIFHKIVDHFEGFDHMYNWKS